MTDDGVLPTASPQTAPLVLGVLIGTAMVALSIAGLTWRLEGGSLIATAAAAVAAATLAARVLGGPGAWRFPHAGLILPLVPILLLAALVPPHTWDEMAYSVALPRDYAQARRFFYNADVGLASAFPGNYEAVSRAQDGGAQAPARSQSLSASMTRPSCSSSLKVAASWKPRVASSARSGS